MLVAWVMIFEAKAFHPSPQPRPELLTSSLVWQVLPAGILLAAVVTWLVGWRRIRFRHPRGRNLPLLWFPVIALL